MSRLDQKFNWTCPKCNHTNTNDLYSNEIEPSRCSNCDVLCDVYINIQIQVTKVVSYQKTETDEDENETHQFHILDEMNQIPTSFIDHEYKRRKANNE
ncbi:hypothetical protein [Bacillus pumilus]|uniref:hypothetical protein n=1 Tax=Bacillus pumilus TaxID=1408 RepID=UPI002111E545|nr:hypothetical protein [Bacillus pumilus]UUD44694.1 hypothetical protein NPA43_18835 [Bacillus pumilus]